MPKEISIEDALKLADEEISNMPKNRLPQFLPVIEKLKSSGQNWKEIAKFFQEKIQIPVKPFHIKTLYDEAHPEEKEKKEKKEKKS